MVNGRKRDEEESGDTSAISRVCGPCRVRALADFMPEVVPFRWSGGVLARSAAAEDDHVVVIDLSETLNHSLLVVNVAGLADRRSVAVSATMGAKTDIRRREGRAAKWLLVVTCPA
ncbi:hypothetical protein HEK616_82190 (plasmid) [Streptomyces nigrescens]|uniref:Uncharacterized protein n=1 Tax=Streptomyces nigrescens TaxID=1920 RepID=A0ABN6R8Q1_STRNI|nr:hypothetical protein HEK616_82190 [Streptomyces nigrescens]